MTADITLKNFNLLLEALEASSELINAAVLQRSVVQQTIITEFRILPVPGHNCLTEKV